MWCSVVWCGVVWSGLVWLRFSGMKSAGRWETQIQIMALGSLASHVSTLELSFPTCQRRIRAVALGISQGRDEIRVR